MGLAAPDSGRSLGGAVKEKRRVRRRLLTADRSVSTVHVEAVVAHPKESLSAFAVVDEAVGALLQYRLAVNALVVQVTLVLVGGGPRPGLARVSELSHGCQVMSSPSVREGHCTE